MSLGVVSMTVGLNNIGQINLLVDDVDIAESFYEEILKLRKLYRFGGLVFFDCAGIRLLIEKGGTTPFKPGSTIIYFRVADIHLTCNELRRRGVQFIDDPHLIAPMEDHDLWMAFFKDPAGNTLAVMQEAPKGYKPYE
jgi:methylmalonyl-CoA/ethylmalonyl-CoA epimerase